MQQLLLQEERERFHKRGWIAVKDLISPWEIANWRDVLVLYWLEKVSMNKFHERSAPDLFPAVTAHDHSRISQIACDERLLALASEIIGETTQPLHTIAIYGVPGSKGYSFNQFAKPKSYACSICIHLDSAIDRIGQSLELNVDAGDILVLSPDTEWKCGPNNSKNQFQRRLLIYMTSGK